MSRIRVTITNNRSQPYTLPDELGGYDVPANSSDVTTFDSSRFHRLEHDDEAREIQALERVEADSNIDVSVELAGSEAVNDIRQRMRQAARGAPNDSATLWVGPNGSDDNPGTKNSPLASVQTAIDRLDESFAIDHPKTVFVKPGIYQENLFINTQNLLVEGARQSVQFDTSVNVKLEDDDPSLPLVTVTNMTRNAWGAFEADGGFGYDFSSASYSYTGASLARDRRHQATAYQANVRIRNIEGFHQNPSSTTVAGLQALAAPNPNDNNEARLEDLVIENSLFLASGGDAVAAFKNVSTSDFKGARFRTSDVVFDRSRNLNWIEAETPNSMQNAIYAGDGSSPADEGGPGFPGELFSPTRFASINGVPKYSVVSGARISVAGFNGGNRQKVAARNDSTFLYNSSGNIAAKKVPVDLIVGSVDGRGSGDWYINDLDCEGGSYTGSGTLDVERILSDDNFTISSGSGHSIHGGHIEGNLTIDGGTDVVLHGVTVHGDLIVDDANTTVTLNGCHVEGTLDVADASNVSVTVSGGTIMNTTDPGANIATETPAIG